MISAVKIKRLLVFFGIVSSMALLGWQYARLGEKAKSYRDSFMSECAVDLTQTRHCQFRIDGPAAGMGYWIYISWPGISVRTLDDAQLEAIQSHTQVTFEDDAGRAADVIATNPATFNAGHGRICINAATIRTSDSVTVDVELMDGFDWPTSMLVSLTYSDHEAVERTFAADFLDGIVRPIVLVLEVALGVILLTLLWRINRRGQKSSWPD